MVSENPNDLGPEIIAALEAESARLRARLSPEERAAADKKVEKLKKETLARMSPEKRAMLEKWLKEREYQNE